MIRPGPHLVVAIVSFGQIVGWGTTYYLPSALVDAFERDLGLTPTTIYLGVTMMLIVSGLASPTAGRLFDRWGAARFLPFGSALIALGLVAITFAPGRIGWLAIWGLFGIAQVTGLSLAAQTYLARLDPGTARRRIGVMLIIGGLSSSIFWPLTAALEAAVGWRTTLLVHAALLALVVTPLHLWLFLARNDATVGESHPAGDHETPQTEERVPKDRRRLAELALVAAFSLQGLASWGLPLHVIELFRELGLDRATAVAVAAVNGPAVILARLAEMTWGGRRRPLDLMLVSMLLLVPTAAAPLLPIPVIVGALILSSGWNGANGVLTLLRVTVPLTLFGGAGFGALSGRIALPMNLAFAAAPAIFAAIIEVGGPKAGVAAAVGCGILGAAATVVLQRIVRTPVSAKPPLAQRSDLREDRSE